MERFAVQATLYVTAADRVEALALARGVLEVGGDHPQVNDWDVDDADVFTEEELYG